MSYEDEARAIRRKCQMLSTKNTDLLTKDTTLDRQNKHLLQQLNKLTEVVKNERLEKRAGLYIYW